MLDARISQQALEIALPNHEQGCDRHGEKAHENQNLPHECRSPGRLADLVDTQNGEEGTIRQTAGKQGSDQSRGLAVGIRLPRVHRRQAHLGAVADEEEDKRRMKPGTGQTPGLAQKIVK